MRSAARAARDLLAYFFGRFMEISRNIRNFKMQNHLYCMKTLNIIIQQSHQFREDLKVFSDAPFGRIVAFAAVDAASSKAK